MIDCPNCGALLGDGAEVCSACGVAIDEGQEPQAERTVDTSDQPAGRDGHAGPQDSRRTGHHDRDRDASARQGGTSGTHRPADQAGSGPIGGAAGGQSRRHQGRSQHPSDHRQERSTDQRSGGGTRREVLKFGGAAAVVLGTGWGLFEFLGDDDLTAEERAARAVVEENMQAYQNENLEGVKSTLHPESPVYERTIRTSETLFEKYDLSYELEIKSVAVEGDEARVRVVQTTRKVRGPEGRDNRVEVTHVLRKYDGEWRIYNTIVHDVEELD